MPPVTATATSLARVLGDAAASVGRTDTFLGERYRRIAHRRGKKRLASSERPGARFHDLGSDYYKSRVNLNRKMRGHVRELRKLGFRVTIEPAA